MRREDIEKALAEHRPALDQLGVASLELFGSTARGEARVDSDIDVLVEFVGPPSFDRYMELRFLLERLFGRKVDLVTRKALRREMSAQVEREAVRVA